MASKGEATNGVEDLLQSYPNLRSLALLPGDQEDWLRTEVPKLPAEVTTDVLPNGLTYFVQENREPKARAELYLIVGFGSLVETEEERGIAHIIEHLGFSATKSYENHAIVKFLESIGAPFGACQNAYTTFDRTVYTLHVPTDKEGLLRESLNVLQEFAFFTRISEDDLEKERKVVLEEWRESRSAQGRLFEQYICELCKGSKWSERLPIGKEEVIRGVPASTLRSFYQKYYHPASMAVVAVGDFDGPTVVESIKELFGIAPEDISPLPREPGPGPERPSHAVPDTKGVAVASSTDPELQFGQTMIDCKRPKQAFKTLGSNARKLTEELFHRTLSSRLLKLTIEPKGPRNFFVVGTESGEPIPPLNPISISVMPLPGRMRPALSAIAREIERVKRFGFHEAEVRRAKRSILAEFEERYIERDQRPSESFAEEYVSLFLDEEPAPSMKYRAQAGATVVPTITCADVSRVAEQYNFEKNVVVKIATPPLSLRNPLYTCWSALQAFWNLVLPRPKMDLPDSSEVARLLGDIAKETSLEPWPEDEDNVDERLRNGFEACAAKRLPIATNGKSASARPVQAHGVPRPSRGKSVDLSVPLAPDGAGGDFQLGEEIVLQNGMRLFLKDTDLFEDEVLLRARRWGGLSSHQNGRVMGKGKVTTEAQICSMSAMMLGICGLSVESLQECLEGKRLDPNPPSLDPYSTGLEASSSPTDLEDLLTLMHLLFQCPVASGAKSKGRLSLVKLGLLAWRLGEGRDPSALFKQRVQKCVTGDHPYSRLPSLWSILRLNFKEASAIFNERASMPRDWTFVIVGRLPAREKLMPMLEKYLGTIPNEDRSSYQGASGSDALGHCDEFAQREAVPPINMSFPAKSVLDEVRLQMIEPKGSTVLCFPISRSAVVKGGDPSASEGDLRELFLMRLVVKLLETRLVEVLRFQRGQVYSVSVSDDFSLSPPQLSSPCTGTLSISFECDPAEADELVDATRAELDKLRDGSAAFTTENVTAALEQERRQMEELFQKNDWWAETILDLYFSRLRASTPGGDLGAATSLWWRVRAEVVGSLDAAGAADALRRILPSDASSAVITMRPKQKRWWQFC